MPSAILIHPAILPQQTCAENWGLRPLFGEGELGPHLTQSRLAYLHSKWHLNPSSHLATRYGPKTGGCAPLGEGELGPHLTQCGQCRGLPASQVSS